MKTEFLRKVDKLLKLANSTEYEAEGQTAVAKAEKMITEKGYTVAQYDKAVRYHNRRVERMMGK